MTTPLRARLVSPWLRRAAVWLAGSVLAFAVVGFYAVPPVLRHLLVRRVSESLHRKASLRAVRVNPFTLRVTLEGFALTERDGTTPFASFESLVLDVQASSLLRRAPVLREVVLAGPRVSLVRLDSTRYNVSDLLAPTPAAPSAAPEEPARFSVANIQVSGGSIDLRDVPAKAAHTVRGLRLGLPFVSNLPERVAVFVEPSFSALVNGTPVSLTGKSRPFSESRETYVELDVKRLDLARYLAYVPTPAPARLGAGTLDTRLTLGFSQPAGRAPAVTLSGTFALTEVSIVDGKGAPLLDLPQAAVTIETLEPLRPAAAIERVTLSGPRLVVTRSRAGRLNLLDLVPSGPGGAGGVPAAPEAPLPFRLGELRITGGTLAFHDEAAPFATTLSSIEASVKDAAADPARPMSAQLAFRTEHGETLSASVRVVRAPLEVGGHLAVEGLDVARVRPYLPAGLPYELGKGTLDLSTDLSLTEAGLALDRLRASLAVATLRRTGAAAAFLAVKRLSVEGVSARTVERTVTIGSLGVEAPALRFAREASGAIDLLPAAPPGGDALSQAASPGEASGRWVTAVDRLTLERGSVRFTDFATSPPARLAVDALRVDGRSLSTVRGTRGRLSARARLNGSAPVSLGGGVTLEPPSVALEARLDGLDLVPFQPYAAAASRIVVTSGQVSLAGRLSARRTRGGEWSTGFVGRASVDGFGAADAGATDDVLSWGSLALEGLDAGTGPGRFRVERVSLADAVARVVVNEDRTVNLEGLAPVPEAPGAEGRGAAAPPAPAPDGGEPPAPQDVAIGDVTLQGGRVELTDRSTKPSFSASFTELGGRVTGLASEPGTVARVELRGKLGRAAPVEVTGSFNPFARSLTADLEARVKDVDLGPWSPYSGRYAGYAIEKGTLSLTLRYRIVERKVEAANEIVLDQFTFGEKVDSPEATKLPVRLAVSLLKDRNGRIHLELPVSGSIDDPKFRVGKVVWKVLGNLLAKAATSPFALLGSLSGSEEELSEVDFTPGSEALDAKGEAKVASLARALADRPALRVEVTGHVDPETDREALRKLSVERKLKAAKRERLLGKGLAAPPLDEVAVVEAEREELLGAAYKKERFAKPRNVLGVAKSLPADEMEKLMLTHAEATDDDLRRLAVARAQKVKETLVAAGPVAADRVFLVEARSLEPAEKAGALRSRVDFVLK